MVCSICKNVEAKIFEDLSSRPDSTFEIDCPQCGRFRTTGSADAELKHIADFDRWKISAWVNEFKPPLISSTEVEKACASIVPSLHQRAEKMLRVFLNICPPGEVIDPDYHTARLMPAGWNQSIPEAVYMISAVLCDELELITRVNKYEYGISAKGLLHLEGRRESVSSVGFCAMWFSEDVLPLWKQAIEPAIRDAGYEPIRIDSKQHNGKIDDEIMASIRSARFVVSDFTGNRGGVYYEAGFAHGLGLPVIFMCRENDLKDIHFDVRQYNCILWTPEKLEEAQSQLKNRILATLGQGPKLVQ